MITQINEKTTAAQASNDTIALAFWRGRLANILIIFDPIPVDEYNVTGQAERLMVNPHNSRLQQWDDEDEEYQPTGPYERNIAANILTLTQGYFYASFVNSSSNFTICDGNYTVVSASFDYFG